MKISIQKFHFSTFTLMKQLNIKCSHRQSTSIFSESSNTIFQSTSLFLSELFEFLYHCHQGPHQPTRCLCVSWEKISFLGRHRPKRCHSPSWLVPSYTRPLYHRKGYYLEPQIPICIILAIFFLFPCIFMISII